MGIDMRITLDAEEKLKEFLASAPPDFLPRIAVESGGCSGFKYLIGLDKRSEEDGIIVLESGMQVLVPNNAQDLLKDVVLGYRKTLMSEGFYFENPSATSCGCGSSFRPKDTEACE